MWLLSLLGFRTSYPSSVTIVGAGPAGLGAAIEAKLSGLTVTLVEKRQAYSRPQGIFLDENTVDLLEKWQVSVSEMSTTDVGNGRKIGFVRICALETALAKKVSDLGINMIFGEFERFADKGNTIYVATDEGSRQIKADILVGADGSHSRIRDELSIPVNRMGMGIAAACRIPTPNPETPMGATPIEQKEGFFARRIKTPASTIIFGQRSVFDGELNPTMKAADLKAIGKLCGWEEADLIDKALEDIPVALQQAIRFSDHQRKTILLGDATATGTFLEGTGANAAFKSASIAGELFKNLRNGCKNAFPLFDAAIKATTDELINDCRFIFPEAALRTILAPCSP